VNVSAFKVNISMNVKAIRVRDEHEHELVNASVMLVSHGTKNLFCLSARIPADRPTDLSCNKGSMSSRQCKGTDLLCKLTKQP